MRSVFFYKATRRTLHKTRLWYVGVWLPVALVLCLVAFQSTARFSPTNTELWLRPRWEHWRGSHLNEVRWMEIHQLIRQSSHFLIYAVVGLTLLRAWLHMLYERSADSLMVWRIEASIVAIFSTGIVASIDEAHQALLPHRSPYATSDVLLDAMAAVTMCTIAWLICWLGRNKTLIYPSRNRT